MQTEAAVMMLFLTAASAISLMNRLQPYVVMMYPHGEQECSVKLILRGKYTALRLELQKSLRC